MSFGKLSIGALTIAGAALIAGPALAQGTSASAPPEIFGALTNCRTIADDAQRLACFDTASARLGEAVEKRDIVVLDRAEVKKTRRSLFGFSLPKLPFFGNDNDEPDAPEFQEINTKVASLRSLGYGKWRIGLEEGAVWQTTEAMRGNPKVGDTVRIKKGLIGAYFLSIDEKRAAKAMRVN